MSEVKMSELQNLQKLQKLVDKKVDLQKLECDLWTRDDRKYRVKRLERESLDRREERGRREKGEREEGKGERPETVMMKVR